MAGEPLFFVMLQQIVLFLLVTRVALRMRRRNRAQQRRAMRRMYRDGQYLGLNQAFGGAAGLAILEARQVDRRIGAYPRSSDWWQGIALDTFDDAQWYRRFRMRRNTFVLLLNDLEPVLRRTDTRMRNAITAETRLAIGIYWLASGDLLRTVADLFGVSEGSVSNIVYEVCSAIVNILGPRYMSFPRGDRLRETIHGYEKRWGFPQCGGAVDGSHIAVKAPSNTRTDFYNRKGWYSMVLQGVVDYRYRFTDVYIGWPGSVHDARVLRNSPIFEQATREDGRTLFPKEFTRRISGTDVPVVLLGDAAYPHLPWLTKPYPDNGHLNEEKSTFNYRHSRARMTVECAFGHLKGRWRCLSHQLNIDLDRVPTVVTACCVLHNICEEHGERFFNQWEVPAAAAYEPQVRPIQQVTPNAARDALARLIHGGFPMGGAAP
ncbi:uncharacterized protein [Branchiostoma lanceolatum]|uniref:uncharacterized protein n=1 Tax=Branchiostoma lanceolatum TaxID=7740 RepID=UPI0034548969